MISILLLLLAIVFVLYLIFLKYVSYFEYKHCLNCPIKGNLRDNEFDVFLENIKDEMGKSDNEKKL